jgi:hypothetical protein
MFLAYTQNVEAPPAFRLWTGISVISAALQRKVWVHFPEHLVTVYPNMYVVLTAPPGVCRKGTIINVGERFLRRLKGPYLLANDITREKMLREMREHPVETQIDGELIRHHSVTCIAEEFSTLLGTKDTDMLVTLTKLWNADDLYKYSTKTSGEDEIPNFYITLLAGTTPQWLSSSLPKEAIGGGFTSRIVFVCETKKQQARSLTDEVQDAETLELEGPLLADLGNHIFKLKGEVQWTAGAGTWYSEWYYKLMANEPSIQDLRFHDYLFGRKPVIVWKTAMCLAASDRSVDHKGRPVITQGTMEQAVGMLDDLEAMMPHAFGGYGQSELSEVQYQVWQVIDHSPGITAEGVMARLIWEIKDKTQFLVMANNLRMGGRITIKEDGSEQRYYSKRA